MLLRTTNPMRHTVLALILSGGLLPIAADAKTLYVNGQTGSDATSYASNGPTTPWRTIGRAAWGSTSFASPNSAEAARAGDVVRIAAGTYSTVGRNDRWGVAYNPANEGVAGSPIRFEGEGVVRLVFSSGIGPMIGANGRDYIEWSGLTIAEATAPSRGDTGQVVFFEAQGGSVENSTLIGNPNWTARMGDNYPAIRIHASRGQRVINNYIADYGGQTNDENHTALNTYWAGDITVENNEIVNCAAGLYLKGNNPAGPIVGWFTIRRNVFRNNTTGVRILLIPSTESQPNLIAQNIFRNNVFAVTISAFDGGAMDPRNAKIINNTFVDNSVALFLKGPSVPNARHMFWNNVVSGPMSVFGEGGPILSKDRVDAEHNLYFTPTHSEIMSTRYSLASWKTAFAQDTASPASQSADPRFVNQAGSDYRLAAGSPALGLGRVVYGVGGVNGSAVSAGAYITGNELIGRSGGSIAMPSTVRNLRITQP